MKIRNFTPFALLAVLSIKAEQALAAKGVGDLLKDAGVAAKYETDPAKADPAVVAGNIIYSLLTILGIMFVGFTIYAGFLWMTAKGEQSQVQKARDILSNSLIGLIIVVGAYAITYFVLYYVTQGLIEQGTRGF